MNKMKKIPCREIVLVIPNFDPEQNVEIDVRINGRSKTIKYRVELLSWEGDRDMHEDRVTVLKRNITNYEKDWELVEIGAPENGNIPLMFRKTEDQKA